MDRTMKRYSYNLAADIDTLLLSTKFPHSLLWIANFHQCPLSSIYTVSSKSSTTKSHDCRSGEKAQNFELMTKRKSLEKG